MSLLPRYLSLFARAAKNRPSALLAAATILTTTLGFVTPARADSTLNVIKTALDLNGADITDVESGQDFLFEIKWSCSLDDINVDICEDVQISDVIPTELEYVGLEEGEGARANYNSGTRTFTYDLGTIQGDSAAGSIAIRVRFPEGVTADNVTANNTAVIESATANPPGQKSSSDDITSDVSNPAGKWNVTKNKLLPSGDPILDGDVTYEVSLAPTQRTGNLNLENVVMTDTPEVGAEVVSVSNGGVFNDGDGDGIVDPGDTITWNVGDRTVGQETYRAQVVLSYPAATFNSSGAAPDTLPDVTNSVTGAGTFEVTSDAFSDDGEVSHGFVDPDPGLANFQKRNQGFVYGSRPDIGTEFYYDYRIQNTGNVAFDTLTVFDDNLPPEVDALRFRTGRYSNDAGATFTLQYSTDNVNFQNVPGVVDLVVADTEQQNFTLPTGTRGIRIIYENAPVGFNANTRPRLYVEVRTTMEDTGATIQDGEDIDNTATLTGVFNGNDYTDDDDVETFVDRPRAVGIISKEDLTNSGPYAPSELVEFRLTAGNRRNARRTLENPVVVDILPDGLAYVANSYVFDAGDSGLSAPSNFEVIENYNGSGQTLLRWTWEGQAADYDDGSDGNAFNDDKTWTITYKAGIEEGDIQGSITNTVYLSTYDTSTDPADFVCHSRGDNDIGDSDDIDGDGKTGDDNVYNSNSSTTNDNPLCRATADVTVTTLPFLEARKRVQGGLNNSYEISGQSYPGGAVDYQITVTNTGTTPIEDLVVVDIFPNIDDTSVLNTNVPRNSEWRPYLVGPIEVQVPTAQVYYSVSSNPCRLNPLDGTDQLWPPGCVDDWTTTFPNDPTTVTAVKIDYGSFRLNPLTSLTNDWPMRVPVVAPTNESAFNSFALTGRRIDRTSPLLPQEPPRVEVDLQTDDPPVLGDFVWNDANNNGVQDDGENGINGVVVELYRPGADGIPGTPDDEFVDFTMTGPNHFGFPGFYEFAYLDPGDYFLKFIPPTGSGYFFTSSSGTDRDDGTGSDANQTTGLTDVITIASGDDERDIDAGLTTTPPTGQATLGDYVWLDANGDGIQDANETGVNGVSVMLYQSDGTFVGTTQTSNDTNGNPGYYIFQNLPPGDYYVEFNPPAGYNASPQSQGSDTAQDSDADPTDVDGTTPGTQARTNPFTLSAGQNETDIDFGIVPQPRIGDYVWIDLNRDGIQDGTEVGLNGVTVNLYEDGNLTPVDTIVTADDIQGNPGYYAFATGGLSGDYSIEFVLPSGYEFSPQNSGSDDTLDSDVNTATGRIEITGVTNTTTDLSLDAGVNQPAPGPGFVGDFVWLDLDEDGIQDPTETGFNDVTVRLRRASDDSLYAETVTADSLGRPGYYLFSNVPDDDYYVEFVLPEDYLASPANAGSDDSEDSDVDSADADPNVSGVETDADLSTSAIELRTPSFNVTSTSDNRTIDMGIYRDPNAPEPPSVVLLKRITAINNVPIAFDGPQTPEEDEVDDLFPSNFLEGTVDGGETRPGDEIEYTIYFISNGDRAAENVAFCDLVPEYTTISSTAFNANPATQDTGGIPGADRGIVLGLGSDELSMTNVADGDRGVYVQPGDPTGLDCGGPNSNGAVVVFIGDIPNANGNPNPNTSYGFVRFRARVQ
ncbi:MAG: SdrD B-like domain-containing protein [Cyanobacteria bacterium P01_A01_bin.123]